MFQINWKLCMFTISNVIFVNAISSITSTKDLSTLQLVQIISRHGDRAPIHPFPTDVYRNASVYSLNGWGELTEVGAKQVYELGVYLRQRYGGFLPRKYLKRDFLILSSDVDRAIMSAEANLAGLYELGPVPRSRDIFKEWQPVPIHTIPEEDDNLINTGFNCPRYKTLINQYMNSDELKKLNEDNKEFLDFIQKKSGMETVATLEDTFQVQDALRCQRFHNLTLPDWVNNTVYDQLQYFKSLSFTWKVATEEMKRLKVGPLLERLVGEMRAKVDAATLILDDEGFSPYEDASAYRKMYIYSGHDSTISGVLHTLNLFQPHIPVYAAALLIELHRKPDTGEFFIEFYYRNDTTVEPYRLDTSAVCGSPCLYESFSAFASKFIPMNWNQECQLQSTQSLSPSSGAPRLLLMSSSSDNGGQDLTLSAMHPLGITAPGLLGFVLAVIAITSLLVSTILLSSFLREKQRAMQYPLNAYQHLG
ncbi:unnamed protein product [Orchesella dallaii]|uniref:acid phosphatase n=1 Tax=Orchesella dallaii TaxID=48710 RepID=A0ABP1QJQ0_9HEXA